MIWSEWKKLAGRVAASIAAAAMTACATPAQQPAAAEQAVVEARPGLWKLADADTTIYLFGTIHALPKGLDWQTPAIERAMAEADEMVMEIAPPEDPSTAARMMMAMAMAPGLPPIVERVPEEKRERLREMIDQSSIPVQAFDGMKTWAAAMTLALTGFKRMGANAEEGVERTLVTPWKEQGGTIGALETAEEQLGFFDTLSEEAQRTMLASTTDDPDEARRQFEAMVEAWRSGDTEAIARTFDSETTMSPELREVLMTRRNARWADWVAERLEQPGTVFVAVGAGHLAGRDSVQAMLARKGLETERVQ